MRTASFAVVVVGASSVPGAVVVDRGFVVVEVFFTDVLEALASERLSERLSEHPERIAASTHMVRADHATRLNALRMISMVLSKALSPLRSREKEPRFRGDTPAYGCIRSVVVSPDRGRELPSTARCSREVLSGVCAAMRSVW